MKLLIDGVDDEGEETGYTCYSFAPGEKAPREWYLLPSRYTTVDISPTDGVYLKYPIFMFRGAAQKWLETVGKDHKIYMGRWYDYTDHGYTFVPYIVFDDPANRVLFHFLFVMSGLK